MKIAVFSPYLDTKGGGERYILTVASIFSEQHEVDLLLPTHLHNLHPDQYKKDVSERLAIDLSKVTFVHAPVGTGSKTIDRYFFLRRYDLLFAVTDGSIFLSSSKKNILHIQTPLDVHPAASKWGQIKLKSWHQVIYNSEFTKKYSQKNWPLPSKVIYPPVEIDQDRVVDKKNIILSVGRFFGYLKEKKHQMMIEAFVKLVETEKVRGWDLYLAGSMGEGDQPYVDHLKSLAAGLPIMILPNIAHQDLKHLYQMSKIYWHAMGYQEEDPTKMEHFGITTVEAMAAGVVPVVIKKGGQIEIVEENKSGLFWQTESELIEETKKLVADSKKLEQLSTGAVERAQMFSQERFKKEILALIND
jgi:glycosyltransferase involved in cell wall biosynthesis